MMWAWWWENWWLARYYTGKWLLELGVASMPNGMPKRELRQALWLWQSTMDIHMAVALNDENNNLDFYAKTEYADQLPERFRKKRARKPR